MEIGILDFIKTMSLVLLIFEHLITFYSLNNNIYINTVAYACNSISKFSYIFIILYSIYHSFNRYKRYKEYLKEKFKNNLSLIYLIILIIIAVW